MGVVRGRRGVLAKATYVVDETTRVVDGMT
jgi:hypothetical protein